MRESKMKKKRLRVKEKVRKEKRFRNANQVKYGMFVERGKGYLQ